MALWKKSIPLEREVCGYKVRKLALGEFTEAIEKIKALPADIIAECMPGVGLDGLLGWLKGIDQGKLTEFLGALLHVAPRYVVQLVADLIDADAQAMMDDKALGPAGLAKVIKAFWEVNELDDFFTDLAPVTKTLGALLSGSRTSSPSA